MHETSPQALDPELLAHLGDINWRLLQLLAATARGQDTGLASPVVSALRVEWLNVPAGALRGLATCPYLLLELALGEAPAIRADADVIREPDCLEARGPVGELTRRAFLVAWHYAHTNPLAVRITLGLSAKGCAGLAALALPALEQLAARAGACPRLRWEDRVEIWRQLLVAAAAGEQDRLRQLQLRGLQLLAAENLR
jgi:hypothetical protein